MTDAVLALNAGSSSIKFALYEVDAGDALVAVATGELEGVGTAPHFMAEDAAGKSLDDARWPDGDHEALLGGLLNWVDGHLGADRLIAVGHRIVHGGSDFTAPTRLTEAVVVALDKLAPLAPLHQPHSLAPVRAIALARPGLPQVGCFDTAFHHTMPAVATRFAIPRDLTEAGVRRYGFHGLSYEYIASHLPPEIADGRVVVAHLGNGASLCAMRAGVSVDTTMGFTALDGLVMGTRCGTLDVGVVLYLLQQKSMSAHEVETLLYKQSGLLGLSGLSSDMRTLVASADVHAKEAIESFVFRIARETAALAASMGGLDGFVFTAGIGEHAPEIRAQVCERLGWLGVVPGEDRGHGCISTAGSKVAVYVIPTDEQLMIALHTLAVVRA